MSVSYPEINGWGAQRYGSWGDNWEYDEHDAEGDSWDVRRGKADSKGYGNRGGGWGGDVHDAEGDGWDIRRGKADSKGNGNRGGSWEDDKQDAQGDTWDDGCGYDSAYGWGDAEHDAENYGGSSDWGNANEGDGISDAQDHGGANSDDDFGDELVSKHFNYRHVVESFCPYCYRCFVLGMVPSVTSGCPFCPMNLFDHFGKLCNYTAKLEARLRSQGKKIVKHRADKAFLQLDRPVHPQADELLKADEIVKIFVYDDANPILAHTFILASKSSVLRRIFEDQAIREIPRVLRISFTKRAVMEAVISFCYNAEISFVPNGCNVTPEEVLVVAHKYRIPYLMEICDEKLAANINDTNLLDRMKVTYLFDLPLTKAVVTKQVKEDFERCYSVIMGGYK